MAVYVNRIIKVAQPLPPAPKGALNLNCLNFFPNNVAHDIPLYEITPYFLKDKESFGHGYVSAACLLGLTHIFSE